MASTAQRLCLLACALVAGCGVAQAFGRGSRGLLQATPAPTTKRNSVPFPYYTCSRTVADTPYGLEYEPNLEDPTAHCFVFHILPCNTSSPCCNMDLYKVVFSSSAACTKSIYNSTVDGSPKGIIFDSYSFKGTTPYAFRISKLFRAVNPVPGVRYPADGARFCFNLDPESACPTLNELCPNNSGACNVAISADRAVQSCCPVHKVYFV